MKFFNKFGNKRNDESEQEQFMDEQQNENEEYEENNPYNAMMPNNPDNVVDFRAAVAGFANNESSPQEISKQLRVIIIEPTSFDDAQQIADHIKTAKPVLLNFERTDPETAKRIVDFMSGVTYALAGEIKKVCDNIFLCAPNNVNVSFADIHPTSDNPDKLPWE